MIEDQIVTILTAVIQGGIVLAVLWLFFNRFMRELKVVKGAAEEQKRALDIVVRRVGETEKTDALFRALLTHRVEDVESCKRFLNKLRDDAIASLSEADMRKDDELKRLSQVKIEKLDLQMEMISEIPVLKEQLSDLLNRVLNRHRIMQDCPFERGSGNSISMAPPGPAEADPRLHPPCGQGSLKKPADHEDTDATLWEEERRDNE